MAGFARGQRLGPYEIVSLLGSGGMGEVYQARDARLNRTVALKVLPPCAADDAERHKHLLREARAASALNHPNIVALHDIISDGGRDALVMEYVAGETLEQKIGHKGVPVKEALHCAIQIAEALAAAHAAGMVHRDIKPGNIMVTPAGVVKVLDFGLAKLHTTLQPHDETATLTAEGTIAGTIAYMSPEQAEGKPLDARSDIFSFGVVLYEMLTGRQAFRGSSRAATLAAVLCAEPPPLRGVPVELQEITERCLRKDPLRRIQHMDDVKLLLEDLELRPRTPELPATHHSTLAVLPFRIVGTGSTALPEVEYLSEGIAESIINNLSQLSSLRVAARTTVLGYKGQDVDARDAGRELNVSAVLSGKVLQLDQNLRIQVELVQSSDGAQLWGRRFNGTLSAIFAIEEEIATQISEALRLRLSGEEHSKLKKRYTDDPEAYRHYLHGRYFWNRRTSEHVRRAIASFQQAIDRDPTYALAWAGLADCYGVCGFYNVFSPKRALPLGASAAAKAIEIDDTLAEPHASLGWILMQQWQWDQAESEFRRALELNPMCATAHVWFGVFLHAVDRLAEAELELQRALELEPLSLIINTLVGWSYCFTRRNDEAMRQLHRTLEIDPSFARAYWDLGITYQQSQMLPEAIQAFRRGLELSADETVWLGPLAQAHALAGDRAEAERMLARMAELARERYVPPFETALVRTALRQDELALESLIAALDDQSTWLCWLHLDPRFDRLRQHARFRQLLRTMNPLH